MNLKIKRGPVPVGVHAVSGVIQVVEGHVLTGVGSGVGSSVFLLFLHEVITKATTTIIQKFFISENNLFTVNLSKIFQMKVVIQRVSRASVTIADSVHSVINKGLLVLLGIEDADDENDVDWLVSKIIQMRIFSDTDGKLNLCVKEITGDILLISQFTLHASTKKGNRPSFIKAARPEKAIPLYESFIKKLNSELGKPCATGVFGADMKVELLNDGPVTIVIDSKNKE